MNKYIRQKNKGLALVIVILILASLVAIAMPFVVSMVFKERTSRNTFHITQTRYDAQASRNSAITTLYQTHDKYEKLSDSSYPYDNADYDTASELKVNLESFSSLINVPNPRGKIWGLDVQDEQGKINILTAPEAILRNLNDILSKKRGVDLRDFITEYSHCSDEWVEPAQLRGYANCLLFDGKTVTRLYTDSLSGRYTRDGAKIRLSNGEKHFYAYSMPRNICTDCNNIFYAPMIDHGLHGAPPDFIDSIPDSQTWLPAGIKSSLFLDRIVPPEFLNSFTILEVAQIYPININTASDEVITSNIIGVGWHGYELVYDEELDEWIRVERDVRITENQAKLLTERIRQKINAGGFKDISEYNDLLTNARFAGEIDDQQKSTLWNNNKGPSDFPDLIEGNFTGTVPFCIRSHDKYTIISTGITNYPSGSEATNLTYREIVDITPPETNVWGIESQYDFNREFISPYGKTDKFNTYPILTTLGSLDSQNPPDHLRDSESGHLKLKPVDDNRGNNPIIKEHFTDTHEGYILDGTPLTYQIDQIFTFPNNLDTSPGGVEMWVRTEEITAPVYFLDVKQSDYENRISVYYDGYDLILSVCDATMANSSAEIRAPVTLQPNTWYHIGAYWKGTKYAQLALFLDGRPVGSFSHYDSAGQAIITELTAELTDTIDTGTPDGAGLVVSVSDTGPFPSSGVIEIGDEAIEYEAKIGGGLRVTQVWQPDPFGGPDILVYHGRGARGTTTKKHPANSTVTVYGYANRLRTTVNLSAYPSMTADRITTGGATLALEIPNHIPAVQIFKPLVVDPNPPFDTLQEEGITSSDTQIPITKTSTCDITEFPSEGYLIIDNEVVFYSGTGTMQVLTTDEFGVPTSVDVPCFTNCQRGMVTTSASNHGHQEETSLYSIQVSNNTDYLDQTLIQMTNEWIGPLQKEGTNYFIGLVNGGTPYPIQRGFLGTTAITQTAGTPLIPVFAAQYSYSGSGDTVTIIEDDQELDKEEKTINLVRFHNNQYLIGFTDDVSREYTIDGTITRLLKFPSDELPSYFPVDCYLAGDSDSAISFIGTIDEIRFFRTTKGDFRLSGSILDSIPASGDSVTMNNVSGLSRPGIIKIGDEIIGYVNTDSGQNSLLNCKRGYLNSPIQTHGNGQRAIHLSFIPIGVLTQDISPDDFHITFTTQSAFLTEGYVLIDDEVIGYPWRHGNDLCMPYDKNFQGIYRGSFGTTPDYHNTDTLILALPFRYFDRYKEGVFETTMAYFKGATKMLNTTWDKINWDDGDSTLPGVQLKMLVRFDGKPSWDTQPTNEEGGIFEFTDPDATNALDIKANQVELLTFFEYLPGAFNTNDWKHSPILKGIWLEYKKPNIMITHQEE